MHIAFTRQLDGMLTDEAQTIADVYRQSGANEVKEAVAERELVRSPTQMMYAVFAPDGRKLYGRLPSARPETGVHDIAFADVSEGPDSARAVAIDLSPGLRLVVAADREWIERIDRTVIAVFAVGFAGACLVGLAGAAILGGYLSRRLRAISGAAEAIIAGDIRERMPVSTRRDEFDQMAATLNRMLDRIEGLVENLRQVSSDIAHDLRTPLARLRNRLEEAVACGDGGKSSPIVEEALNKTDELLSLFSAILRVSEVESGETRRFFTTVDLTALAIELAESFAPAIEDDGRTLLWSVEPNIESVGDRELLAQAVINLVENAERHTPAGTIIRLTLVRTHEQILLQVADNGPGVPSGDLPRITRRFARLERSRNTAGYGLGLSLVSAVARLHGGRLIVKNDDPGLATTIELPIRDPGRAELPAQKKENP